MVLSGAGRALSLTKRTARKLPAEPDVLEIDATSPEKMPRRAPPSWTGGIGSTGCSTPLALRHRIAWARMSSPIGTTFPSSGQHFRLLAQGAR